MKLVRMMLSVLGAVCLLLPCTMGSFTVSAAGNTDYTLADMQGHYKTQGRIHQTSERLFLDWSASGIEFSAYCSGDVYIKFEADSVMGGETGACYFSVLVDGVEKPRNTCRLIARGTQKVRIASNLPEGEHRFELYRQSAIGSSSVSVNGVSLNGTLLDAPKENDLYIEFIGDSITTANGNLATSTTANSGDPLYSNAVEGYAYMTAHDMLGADFSLVAISGIGASVGWQAYDMQEVYPKLRYPQDTSTNYDFARQPDVIVLALGTNDLNRYTTHNMTLEEVKQGFADMLKLVRQKNPKSKIVWIHGMMLSSASGLIMDVIEEAGGADKGFYELFMVQNNSGGNGHPNLDGHTYFAEDLSNYIRELMVPMPEVKSATDDSLTLKAVAGYEYSCDGKTWQSSPVFTDLKAGPHTFYQRKAETATTLAGIASLPVRRMMYGKTTTTATTTTTRAPNASSKVTASTTTAVPNTTTLTNADTTSTSAVVAEPTSTIGTTTQPSTTTPEATTTVVSNAEKNDRKPSKPNDKNNWFLPIVAAIGSLAAVSISVILLIKKSRAKK